MSSAQSGASLAGSDTFFSNSSEGLLFSTLVFGRTGNPVVIVDEMDKIPVTKTDGYRPEGALYGLLESRTAREFRDLSVPDLKVDASGVLWFATTNDVELLPAPIRSRFKVFHIRAPNCEETSKIARGVYRRMRDGESWGKAFKPELSDKVANQLGERSPRELRRLIRNGFGRAARMKRDEIMMEDIDIDMSSKPDRGMGFVWEAGV